jgi:hypothetical protein
MGNMMMMTLHRECLKVHVLPLNQRKTLQPRALAPYKPDCVTA